MLRSAAAKRPSPSPSVKKAKVERLIKEHGSPPGRRVTAGGRIVPTDFSFANSSHYYAPWMQSQPFHAAHPFGGNAVNLSDLPNGLVGYNLSQKLCQIVDGQFREIKDGNLYMAAPNLPFPIVSVPQPAELPTSDSLGPYSYQLPPDLVSPPSVGVSTMEAVKQLLELNKMPLDQQIDLVSKKYEQLSKDCNQLERLAILKEKEIDAGGREFIIQRKREYVRQMDDLRKLRKDLEDTRTALGKSVSTVGRSSMTTFYGSAADVQAPPAMQYYGKGVGDATFKDLNAPTSLTSNNMPISGAVAMADIASQAFSYSSSATVHTIPTLENGGQASPNSANSNHNKRSHAIEIKQPAEKHDRQKISKSNLDPRSPAFQAATFFPPSPSMIASPAVHPAITNTWLDEKVNEVSPDSSISTSNFFPNDPAEHSRIKHTFQKPLDAPAGAQMSAFSGLIHNTTPQKDWARNSHIGSHSGSPETNDGHQAMSTHVSPFDHRIVSGYQESPAHHGSVRATVSPRHVRHGVQQMQSPAHLSRQNSMDNTPARLCVPGTEGKSDDWYVGYQVGLQGLEIKLDSAKTTVDFLGGYVEGRAYREKSPNAFHTPEKRSSRRSSQASLYHRTPQSNSYAAMTSAARRDSAVNLPITPNYMARTHGSQENFNHTPMSYSSVGAPMSAGYGHRVPLANGFSDYGTGTALTSDSADLTPRRIMSNNTRSAYVRGESAGQVELTQMSPTTIDGGFAWKDVNLQTIQAAKSSPNKLFAVMSGNRHSSNGANIKAKSSVMERWTPGHKMWQPIDPKFAAIGAARRGWNNSQVDGAVDDLAELDTNTLSVPKSEKKTATPKDMSSKPVTTASGSKFVESSLSNPKNEETSKKTGSSPTKVKEVTERVTNRIKRVTGVSDKVEETDPAKMSAKQKDRRRSQWRNRFREMQKRDREEANEYRKNNPLP